MNAAAQPLSSAATIQSMLEPSVFFKQQVSKVIFSIFLFLIVYLLLIAAAVALAAACFYAGIAVIAGLGSLYGIIAGLGLMAVGGSVIFFLIKFVFAVTKNGNPQSIEITEKDQPELFAFIRKLTEETKTPFPKKIFVSPDVNACVFYNSSFWSMFLPVRKNLEIGLGLVNTVNITEFKAVMAHEFGHFSQRSMKLGSFTYNVNRVIYNMLYENNSYANFLNSWGQLHGLLGVFAAITGKIATGIQWVLRGMYKTVNVNYKGLSREMEFHADAVAASVAGGNNLISSLSRIEVAQSCYNSAINKANDWLKKNKVSRNIFNNQLTILQSVAKEFKLPVKHGLPEVSFQFVQSFSKSRVNYKDQWASHPTIAERKAHLDKWGVDAVPDEKSAWSIFLHPEQLQEQITASLYQAVQLGDTHEIYEAAHFDQWHAEERKKYALPEIYKGYYDNRYIDAKDWKTNEAPQEETLSFDQLFNDANGQLCEKIKTTESDLALVEAIRCRQIDVKSFDFDGKKYLVKQADAVIEQLKNELDTQKNELLQTDWTIYRFFNKRAGENAALLAHSLEKYNTVNAASAAYLEVADRTIDTLQPLYQPQLTEDIIWHVVNNLKEDCEPALKSKFRQAIDSGIISNRENDPLREQLESFIGKQYVYFVGGTFNNNELEELDILLRRVAAEWNEYKFSCYKKLLEDQLRYMNSN
ncbi:MAG: M48 family metallopeptidase [Agriterribacter sp.]